MKKLHFSGLLALIALLLLSTCSNPAGNKNEEGKNAEEGTFTINLGAFSRSADYPPDDSSMGPNPSGPLLAELKFEVIFTEVVSSTKTTFTFASGQTASGKIAVGTYAVTMNVLYKADNSPYAKGVALLNPVEIKSGANTNISIQVYDPEDALPPVISAQPASTDYDLTDTPSALTVTAASIDGGTLSYQWYSSPTDTNDSAAPGVVSVGTNSPSYTPVFTTPMAMEPLHYFVEITNTYSGGGLTTNTVASNTAKIQVVTAPVIIDNTVTLVGFYNLADAMTHLNTNAAYIASGTYTVKIREDQNQAPFSMSNTNIREVILIAEPPGNTVTVKVSTTNTLVTIGTNLTLTLDAGITLQGRADNNTWLIYVSGKLIMKDGSAITGNNNSSSGGGVYVNGIFIMEGGEIKGNTAGTGGGVSIGGGSFTMAGGEIKENTASSSGGGVHITSGSFIMEGGEIKGNTAGSGGGVIITGGGGSFTMAGGEIKGNIASAMGAGVYAISDLTKAPAGLSTTSGTITGYDDDPVNGNVVKDASDTIIPNWGHAVYVNGSTKREKTVGSTEHMSWVYSTLTAIGDWTDPP